MMRIFVDRITRAYVRAPFVDHYGDRHELEEPTTGHASSTAHATTRSPRSTSSSAPEAAVMTTVVNAGLVTFGERRRRMRRYADASKLQPWRSETVEPRDP